MAKSNTNRGPVVSRIAKFKRRIDYMRATSEERELGMGYDRERAFSAIFEPDETEREEKSFAAVEVS
jgi:hypothetical protein